MRSDNILVAVLSVTILILILIVGMILIIMRARRQHIDQQLKEATYKNKLHEMSLAALRAQMNPHFIFNCLNSIKLYTEQNDTASATDYLNKFSKLIRNILDNARLERTMLSTEVETLQLYLDLEAMRFKNRLQFEIIVDEHADIDFIEIPALLVQPYVENAIWHGIMHKDEPGKVTIHILQNDKGTELTITIKDNGIGRKKAGEIKSKNNETHRSYATRINEDRIELFNEMNAQRTDIEITDLTDDKGNAAGTLVTIKLPLI